MALILNSDALNAICFNLFINEFVHEIFARLIKAIIEFNKQKCEKCLCVCGSGVGSVLAAIKNW